MNFAVTDSAAIPMKPYVWIVDLVSASCIDYFGESYDAASFGDSGLISDV